MNQLKEQETTFTLVTTSDVEETVRLRVVYFEAKQYYVDVTKEELINWEFDVNNVNIDINDDRFVFDSAEYFQDPDVSVEDEDTFEQWQEEWEHT